MNIWGRLGISVAIVATFSIIMTEVLQGTSVYESHRWVICAALLVMGAFLLLVGRFVNRQMRQSHRTEEHEAPQGPFILVNMEYWGLMLTIFGIIVVFIVPFKKVEARAVTPAPAKQAVKTNPVVKAAATNASVTPPPPPPAKPVTFPPLKLQGIVVRQEKSSALINGRTYFVGDYIGDARVFSVGTTNAVVELEGQFQTLNLD